jgi:hypothetical protein
MKEASYEARMLKKKNAGRILTETGEENPHLVTSL